MALKVSLMKLIPKAFESGELKLYESARRDHQLRRNCCESTLFLKNHEKPSIFTTFHVTPTAADDSFAAVRSRTARPAVDVKASRSRCEGHGG